MKLATAGVAAWISVMAGALFTSLEIWLSGNAQLQVIITAMLGVHALIGIGEALITVAALSFIFRTRPDLLDEKSESEKGGIGWVVAGVLITLIVVLLSPLASADPDGLEHATSLCDPPGLHPASPGQNPPFDHIGRCHRCPCCWGCDCVVGARLESQGIVP
jgi:hypothetical protein